MNFHGRRRIRKSRGSALSEVGPAIFLLVVVGLLPAVDMIFLGIDYAAAYTLNELQLREAQKSKKSQTFRIDGPVIEQIPAQWRKSLLGSIAPSEPDIQTQVSYQPVPWQPVGTNQTLDFWFVSISTAVRFRPLIIVPFMKGVPGLGAPFTLTISGRRPMENNRFLNE